MAQDQLDRDAPKQGALLHRVLQWAAGRVAIQAKFLNV